MTSDLQSQRADAARDHRARCDGNLLVRRHLEHDDWDVYVYECSKCYASVTIKDMLNPLRADESYCRYKMGERSNGKFA